MITAEERVNTEGGEQCEMEWKPGRKDSLCRPHRCELPLHHKGEPHKCGCGWTRRWMKRDAPNDQQ